MEYTGKKKQTPYLLYIAATIGILVFAFAYLYGIRLFSNATTPIVVQEVKPGVECATMVTADGAAIDCWKN